MAEANFAKMTSMHFYAWKNGLKTGQYYLRTRPSRDAIKFTVDMEQLLKASDLGNTEEILKALDIKEKPEDSKEEEELKNRVNRMMSFDVQDEKTKRTIEEIEAKASEEMDDIVFECINCSG